MKKLKTLLCLVLVFAMVISTSVVSFAASVSHVSYNEATVEDVTTVTSTVFVAGQDKEVKLYTAVYDAQGNFVKAVTSTAAKTGLLKTEMVKEEGQTVKSFVWDADKNPFYAPAEEAELTAEDINAIDITFDGKDSSVIGIEKLELGKTYDVDVAQYNLETIPYINVTSKEATLTASVDTDVEELQTVITISKGANGKETVTKSLGGSTPYDVQRYGRTSDTITINWVKNYITDADFTNANSSTKAGWRYDVLTDLPDRYTKKVTLSEEETVKKVSVKFGSFVRQETVVVVKPAATAAESYKADPKSIVVTEAGAALTWINDTAVIDKYYWNSTSDDYNTSCIGAYGQKSNANVATVATNAVPVYYPVKAVMSNPNGYETGSRTCTDRNPNTHQKQIYNLGTATDLLGNPYIIGPSTTYADGVVTFYIADDAEISVLSRASGTVTFSVADGEYVNPDSKTSVGGKAIYTNNASAADVAWLIRKGYLKETDISATGSNPNKAYTLNSGATVQPTSYTLRTWDYVMRNTKVMPEHGYKIPDVYTSEKNYTYQEILDMWKDDKFVVEEKPLVENFVAKTRFEGVGTFRYPENLSDYNKEEYANTRKLYEDYNYNVAVGNVARLGKKGTFPCASFYPDRSGEGQASGTGAVVNYPEAFGLEDAYYVLPYLNLVNGPRFGAIGMTQSGDISKLSDTDVWRQAEPTEWASFTVTRDAKVTVFTDTKISSFTDDTTGWNYSLLSAKDCISVLTTASNKSERTFAHSWTKFFPAGSKVVLTTPKASSLYATFITEWDSGEEINVDLKAITLNGVALEGFDAATTEYTYDLGINETKVPTVVATPADYSADVKIVKPTEFPGNLKVVVSNKGVEKTYTINFEAVAGPYSSNLVMTATNNINFGASKATLRTNLQNGDLCFNDRTTATMVMKNVAPEYIGKEWVRGSLGWQNDSTANKYSAEWKSTELYPDWISFDIARNATIHIISAQGPNSTPKAAYLMNNGWGFGYNANGYLTVYTASDQKMQTRFTKHFTVDPETGKATVQIPNIGGLTLDVVIVYDGWTE